MKEIENLYYKYNKDVFRYLYSLTRDKNLSEDLLQETFIRTINSINSFKGNSSIKTWLFSIARHSLYDYYRKNKIELSIEDLLELPKIDFHSEYSYNNLNEIINKFISKQEKIKQNVFNMRIEGYSYNEIGEKLDITSGSARVIFFRIKNELKKKLEKEGYFG